MGCEDDCSGYETAELEILVKAMEIISFGWVQT